MFLTTTKTNKTLRITQEILSQSAGYEGQYIKFIFALHFIIGKPSGNVKILR